MHLPIGYSVIVALTGLPIGYSVIVALTGLLIGYSVIVALTGLPIGYSIIVALTGLPIGYSVIVALTGLPIGYSVIVALTGLSIGYSGIRISNRSPYRIQCNHLFTGSLTYSILNKNFSHCRKIVIRLVGYFQYVFHTCFIFWQLQSNGRV